SFARVACVTFLLYVPMLNRIYTTHPTGGTVSIPDAPTSPPNSLTPVVISEYSPQISTDPQNPCHGQPVTPVSVTALPDGTRAYVASYQVSGAQICSQVSVINTTNNT